jgi:hypothetical protein
LIAAAKKDVTKLTWYEARTRGDKTARKNASQPKPDAFANVADSGIRTINDK